MQPPITTGTIFQNRYRIIKTLGQGSFGRTYLIEDQRHFNELCILKELILTTVSASSWQKARDLFRREAEVLNQIKHTQLPQLREQFEQDQRLFFVNEYIEGKTYRNLLEKRQAKSSVFTQTEAIHLMRSLLPVLTYIHGKGIIHQDISPENIVLRDSDKLPVLIDFGSMKKLASRLQYPVTTSSNAYIGKLGYSPTEQIHTGKVYPSSDLYALAMTAIVLLTGKEPRELFDEQKLAYNWQHWVTLNPMFSQLLNRILSYQQYGRYQNVAEMAQILEAVEEVSRTNMSISEIQSSVTNREVNGVSSKTLARDNTAIPASSTSVLNSSLTLGAFGATIVVFSGLGSLALVHSIRTQKNNQPTNAESPQTYSLPGISKSFTPIPTVMKQPPIEKKIKRLIFNSSNTAKDNGSITLNQLIRYTFRGQTGQQITVMLAQESGVHFNFLAPNEQLIENTSENSSFYQGILPVDGEYKIDVTTSLQVNESDYSLYVGIEAITQPVTTDTSTDISSLIPILSDVSSSSLALVPISDFTVPITSLISKQGQDNS